MSHDWNPSQPGGPPAERGFRKWLRRAVHLASSVIAMAVVFGLGFLVGILIPYGAGGTPDPADPGRGFLIHGLIGGVFALTAATFWYYRCVYLPDQKIRKEDPD